MGSAFGISWDPSSWAVRLAILTFGISVLVMATPYLPDVLALAVLHGFVLRPEAVLHGELWQLLTYSFTATGTWGLLFSVYAIWAFGAEVERRLGSRTFLGYFFGLALAGALVTIAASLAFRRLRAHPYLGSAAVGTGLIVVWARLHRGAQVFFFFFPMRAELLVLLTLVMLGLSALEAGPTSLIPDFTAFFVAELTMRGGFDWTPRRLYLRWRAWRIEQQLRKRARNFTVIPGGHEQGEDDGEDKPKNGYLN